MPLTRRAHRPEAVEVVEMLALIPQTTPQPFGGVRWWALCPVTGARAAVLYMPAGRTRFASIGALRGSYRTQRISPRDRAMERAQDIDIALGGDGNLFDWWPHKPPRMHWTTFDRKWERASRARDRSIAALADMLDRTKPAWRRSALAGKG